MSTAQRFLEILLLALDQIQQHYYNTDAWQDLRQALDQDEAEVEREAKLKRLKPLVTKYSERTFCYELYHHIRVLIEQENKRHDIKFGHTILQAEFTKNRITGEIEKDWNVKSLDAKYIPDFLLHSPGDYNKQMVIVEVKVKPKLDFASIKKDLAKIDQFLASYKYEQGVFLAANASTAHL